MCATDGALGPEREGGRVGGAGPARTEEVWEADADPYLYLPPGDEHHRTGPSLSPEESHHALKVCRLRKGHRVRAVDGEGHEFLLRLGPSQGSRLHVEILARRTSPRELRWDVALGLPLLHRASRLEWMLEKATELGVHRFWPVRTKRTVVVPVSERFERRRQRWERIVVAAMKQAGRAWRPRIEPPRGLEELLVAGGRRCVLWATPAGEAMPARAWLEEAGREGFLLLVGPEGGWDEAEEEMLRDRGARAVRLGPHRLRSETAVVQMLSLLQDRLLEG
jgi:16S rRNA (uracil1498-N3)-methyltransferase